MFPEEIAKLQDQDQKTAQFDDETKQMVKMIRTMRLTEPDENKITENVIDLIHSSFERFPDHIAYEASLGALARTLVLLSRTDRGTNL